ncbi:MAG: MarR family transcriptional regulator [Dehalococcoidia bacterium]|nr:MarR family transcriptional regulator [Dehalococcoidia bacterium]
MYDARKHICFNVGRVMRRVYDHYEKRLSPFSLTPPQYFVFNALWMGDGISVGELGERVSLDSSTLTGVIDRMQRSGYVERQLNPQDRRSVLVFLTAKARELGPRIVEFADELDATLRHPFSNEEMDTFERVLRSLAEPPGSAAAEAHE